VISPDDGSAELDQQIWSQSTEKMDLSPFCEGCDCIGASREEKCEAEGEAVIASFDLRESPKSDDGGTSGWLTNLEQK
jgi:hypothetical protein